MSIYCYCRDDKYEEAPNEPLKVVCFVKDRSKFALEWQVKELHKYCSEKGYIIIGTKRELCNKKIYFKWGLFRALLNKRADAVIISDVSAFSKEYDAAMNIVKRFQEKNKKVISARDNGIIKYKKERSKREVIKIL